MLILCADAPILVDAQAIVPALTKALPELKSIYFLHQNRRPAHALDGICTHLWGERTLDDTLLGLTFSLSPQSVFQVNPVQTEVLYRRALEAAGLSEGCNLRILDVYCGAGTITLAAARLAKHATGVEIVPPAIADAKKGYHPLGALFPGKAESKISTEKVFYRLIHAASPRIRLAW